MASTHFFYKMYLQTFDGLLGLGRAKLEAILISRFWTMNIH